MKKCKNCKKPFSPRFSTLEKYCWDLDCKSIEAMQKLNKIKQRERKEKRQETKRIKESLKTLSQLKNELQKLVNTYVRMRDKGQPCISCQKPLGQKYDAGHFLSVGNYPSCRYDLRNINAQCVSCNQYKGGAVHEYRPNLIQKIGESSFNDLYENRHQEKKYSRPEILELISLYKVRIKNNL